MTTVTGEFRHFSTRFMDGGVLSEISDCGHDVRRGRQSSRRAEYRLQMEQRHVCVNIMEQLTDTGEPIMTAC